MNERDYTNRLPNAGPLRENLGPGTGTSGPLWRGSNKKGRLSDLGLGDDLCAPFGGVVRLKKRSFLGTGPLAWLILGRLPQESVLVVPLSPSGLTQHTS